MTDRTVRGPRRRLLKVGGLGLAAAATAGLMHLLPGTTDAAPAPGSAPGNVPGTATGVNRNDPGPGRTVLTGWLPWPGPAQHGQPHRHPGAPGGGERSGAAPTGTAPQRGTR